jgi:hypothetical protein
MNRSGTDWCLVNRGKIIGWMRQEFFDRKRRGMLPPEFTAVQWHDNLGALAINEAIQRAEVRATK